MPLADDIQRLRDDSLAALEAGHDYYEHTRGAWRFVDQMIVHEGRKITIENQVTGNVVSEEDLPKLAHQYVTGYLVFATFQDFVSLFESFFFDLLKRWLIEHPIILRRKQVAFETVLDAADRDEIIRAVVDNEVNSITYKRVAEWFEYLDHIVTLDCPTRDQIDQLAEIKAARDILVHNKGLVNRTYLGKAGAKARFQEGEILEVPEHYHRDAWQLIRQIVTDMANAALGKA